MKKISFWCAFSASKPILIILVVCSIWCGQSASNAAEKYFWPETAPLPYPKLANYYLKYDPLDNQTTNKLAYYDLLIFDMEMQHVSPSALSKIRSLHPGVILLAYFASEEWEASAYYDNETDHLRYLIFKDIDAHWWLLEPYNSLAQNINSSQTSIPVNNASQFKVGQDILCESEHMHINSKSGNNLNVQRGLYSIAKAHLKGSHIAAHASFWPGTWMLNVTNVCPTNASGQRWNTYLPTKIHQLVSSSGAWDGLYFDNCWSSLSSTIEFCDFNNDGVDDNSNQLDSAWREGMQTMLNYCRSLEGTETLLMGNGEPVNPYFSTLNGLLNEEFPSPYYSAFITFPPAGSDLSITDQKDKFPWQYYSGWNPTLSGYLNWSQNSLQPTLSVLNSCYIPYVPTLENDYDFMRLGLTSALLGNGFFAFDNGADYHDAAWWYDEYDNVGAEHGYLGQPLEDAYEVLADTEAFENFESSTSLFILSSLASKVCDGNAYQGCSILGNSTSASSSWNDFMASDPSKIQLESGETYTISFNYKVLSDTADNTYYFYAKNLNSSDSPNISKGFYQWYDENGIEGLRRVTFKLKTNTNYALVFGIKGHGKIVIDNVAVIKGEGGLWARHFEGGLVICNPTKNTQSLPLDTYYRKIQGVQDPVHNNGAVVNSLVINPYDGYVLLNLP